MPLFYSIVLLMGITWQSPAQSNFCQVYGSVYEVEYPEQADFLVYEADSEAFADILIFEEDNRLMADREGKWYFTDNPHFADYTVYFVDRKGMADFTVYFTNFESMAGCGQ